MTRMKPELEPESETEPHWLYCQSLQEVILFETKWWRRKLAELWRFFWRFVERFKDTRESWNIFTDISSDLNQNSSFTIFCCFARHSWFLFCSGSGSGSGQFWFWFCFDAGLRVTAQFCVLSVFTLKHGKRTLTVELNTFQSSCQTYSQKILTDQSGCIHCPSADQSGCIHCLSADQSGCVFSAVVMWAMLEAGLKVTHCPLWWGKIVTPTPPTNQLWHHRMLHYTVVWKPCNFYFDAFDQLTDNVSCEFF